MMASDYIVEVTEADFEHQVLAYSQHVPVLVDFWAEWCIPCKTLGPVLVKLAEQYQGAFRLAKVNVDSNQRLALRYNVSSIPAVKAFRNGRVVAEFVGAQPEPKVREFINRLAPSESDLILEKAESMLKLEQWKSAESAFREVLAKSPGNSRALLGLAKSLLLLGRSDEAQQILGEFPTSREFGPAQTLLPLATAMERELQADGWSDNPLDALYNRAIRLITRGNLPAAMDGLLDVLREDKRYRQEEARRVMLGIFELLGADHPLTREYRQELASVLF